MNVTTLRSLGGADKCLFFLSFFLLLATTTTPTTAAAVAAVAAAAAAITTNAITFTYFEKQCPSWTIEVYGLSTYRAASACQKVSNNIAREKPEEYPQNSIAAATGQRHRSGF